MGDDEAYDSDEYDEAVVHKAEAGGEADGEDWGEFEEEDDDWGTTGAAALAAKKRAQRAAASEGRIYTVQVRPVLRCVLSSVHHGNYVLPTPCTLLLSFYFVWGCLSWLVDVHRPGAP